MGGEDKSRELSEPAPPEAPDIERRFKLHAYQVIGLPLLVLIPVLALAGVFGETRASTDQVTGSLHVQVDYPKRLRYSTASRLTVLVTNRSTFPLDSLAVSFDPAYLSGFSDLTFTPEADRAFSCDLLDLSPGEERRVIVEYRGRAYWRRPGRIVVKGAGADSAALDISTFVYP
jgi:hypothetical protein